MLYSESQTIFKDIYCCRVLRFHWVSLLQRKTTTRLRQLYLWARKLMEERTWPSSPRGPWLTCCMGSMSRTTSPMWWPMQLVSARTRSTVTWWVEQRTWGRYSLALQPFSLSLGSCADPPQTPCPVTVVLSHFIVFKILVFSVFSYYNILCILFL